MRGVGSTKDPYVTLRYVILVRLQARARDELIARSRSARWRKHVTPTRDARARSQDDRFTMESRGASLFPTIISLDR